jgi:hypothetical protein
MFQRRYRIQRSGMWRHASGSKVSEQTAASMSSADDSNPSLVRTSSLTYLKDCRQKLVNRFSRYDGQEI